MVTLRDPNYAKLLTGQVIAAFGDRINQTALLSIVVYLTTNTSKYSADILSWAILPSIVFGPFAVALIDRWNRQTTMIISDVARAFLAASLPLVMYYVHHHYAIYAVVFWIGTFSALFAPCRLALMPSLVSQELLMSANAISSQAGTVATLISMPIAGLIVERFGHNTSFQINALTYLTSAVFIWCLRPSNRSKGEAGTSADFHPWKDFSEGLRFIRKTRKVLFYVIFTGFVNCLVAIFFVAFITYGSEVVLQSPQHKVLMTCLLFLALGLGMAGGAVWLSYFSKIAERFSWPMQLLAGAGIWMIGLSLVTNPWLAGLVLFGVGFCAVMVLVPLDTFLQKNVPDGLLGRAFAARGVLVGIAFLISLQFSKAILHRFGVMQTFQLLGSAALVLGLVGAWIGSRWGSPHANSLKKNDSFD